MPQWVRAGAGREGEKEEEREEAREGEGTAAAPPARASCSSMRRAAAHGPDAPSLSLSHRPDAAVPLGPHARGTWCYGAAGG
jgi:hypothetical protein